MNSLQVFSNSEFGNIRTVTIDGEPTYNEFIIYQASMKRLGG